MSHDDVSAVSTVDSQPGAIEGKTAGLKICKGAVVNWNCWEDFVKALKPVMIPEESQLTWRVVRTSQKHFTR